MSTNFQPLLSPIGTMFDTRTHDGMLFQCQKDGFDQECQESRFRILANLGDSFVFVNEGGRDIRSRI